MRKLLGYILVLIPFIAVAVLSSLEIGVLLTLVVFGVTALIIGTITLGVWLLQ